MNSLWIVLWVTWENPSQKHYQGFTSSTTAVQFMIDLKQDEMTPNSNYASEITLVKADVFDVKIDVKKKEPKP